MAQIPQLFDRAAIARHLARRSETPDFVTTLALDDLEMRLSAITRSFTRALLLAPDTRGLPITGRSANGPFDYAHAATHYAPPGAVLVEPEALVLPHDDYDLIVSLFDLAVINDVPGFLARLRAQLRPDGLFVGVTLGSGTLTELRSAFLAADARHSGGAYGRVAPFLTLADAGGLLQRAGFGLPVTDVETHVVRYADPLRLMRELKAMGAQNPLADRPGRLATRALLATALESYAEAAADMDGRVRASLELIWIAGWAPDASQQKPLRRGSATVSMQDVLGRFPAVTPDDGGKR